jgi:ribosomal protein S18 acetylase RimI-like enzyme
MYLVYSLLDISYYKLMQTQNNPEALAKAYLITEPSRDDAEELTTLTYQSWVDTYPNKDLGITKEYVEGLRDRQLTDGSIQALKERIDLLETNTDYFLRVAKNNGGEIVGFIEGTFDNDKYELQSLFLKETAIGSGLATQLWESYKLWAAPEYPIWLQVAPYTHRAIAFYKRKGFEIVPNSDSFSGSTHIPLVVMEYHT